MTTPAITSHDGVIEQGGTVIFTGTSLFDDPTANYDPTFDADQFSFEGANLAADDWAASGMSYVSDVALLGNQSARWSISGNGTLEGGTHYRNVPMDTTAGADCYYRLYTRMDFTANGGDGTFPNHYHKIAANYTPGALSINWDWIGDNDVGAPYDTFDLIVNQAQDNNVALPAPIENGRWYCMTAHIPGSSPYNTTVHLDGELLISVNLGQNPQSYLDDWRFPWNLSTGGLTVAGYVWYDGMAASNVGPLYPANRIIFSDSATYGSGNEVAQEPLAIGNTEVSIKANLVGLTNGPPYYAFAINARNEVSDSYALSGSSPATLRCCKTASGVVVPPNIAKLSGLDLVVALAVANPKMSRRQIMGLLLAGVL